MYGIQVVGIVFGSLLGCSAVLADEPADEPVAKMMRLEHPKSMRGWCDVAPKKYPDLRPSYREVSESLNAVPLLLDAKKSLVGSCLIYRLLSS